MKKKSGRILLIIFIIVSGVYMITSITGYNYIYKALFYNYANIDDYKIFYNRTVESGVPQPIPLSGHYHNHKLSESLSAELDSLKTVAFLLVQNDSIQFEKYWDDYSDTSYSNSFSIAKSIVSILTGVAIKEGYIHSLDQPVSDFLPQFKIGDKSKIKLKDLLTMTSGTNWDEGYSSLLSSTTEAYYGTDLLSLISDVNVVNEPGTLWRYKSADTETMGLVLEKATGKNLSKFASEKLWKPIGAVRPALWSLDEKLGDEKAYCCFNSNARDFAKIGQLYLDSGKWNGNEIIPIDYYLNSIQPVNVKDEDGNDCNYYGYYWWLLPEYPGVFYARGILGQYIIVIPQKNAVIVRLGEERGRIQNQSYREVYDMVDWVLKNY